MFTQKWLVFGAWALEVPVPARLGCETSHSVWRGQELLDLTVTSCSGQDSPVENDIASPSEWIAGLQ